MTWLDAGDRLAKKIWLDRVSAINPPTPRTLRWWPLLILAAVPIGFVIIMIAQPPSYFFGGVGHEFRAGPLAVGMILFVGGFMASNLVRLFGPLLMARKAGEVLDERDLAIRARAFSLSGSIVAWLAVAGCGWFGLASFFGGWMPRRPFDWIYLGMVLGAWALTLPVLIASWLQPREAPDAGE